MSVNIYDKDTQTLTEVAGTGTVEFGASTVRTGTVANPTLTDSQRYSSVTVTFSTPMPDSDYVVELERTDTNWANTFIQVSTQGKTKNGFRILFSLTDAIEVPSGTFNVKYTAFKLHTVEGLEELETAVSGLQTLGTEVTHSWQGTVSALATTYSTNYTLPTGGKWLVIAEYELNQATSNPSGVYNLTLTDARNVSGYGTPNGNLGKNMHVYSGGTTVTAGAAFYANTEYLNYPLKIWIKGYKIGV